MPIPNRFRLQFRVEGQSVPKQSFRIGKNGGHYTSPRVKAYAELVGLRANEAMKLLGAREPYPGAVSVSLKFKRKGRGDADNLAKGILDSINGIVIADDEQVRELHVYLERGVEHPEMIASVEAL